MLQVCPAPVLGTTGPGGLSPPSSFPGNIPPCQLPAAFPGILSVLFFPRTTENLQSLHLLHQEMQVGFCRGSVQLFLGTECGELPGSCQGIEFPPLHCPLSNGKVSLWELSFLHSFGGPAWCEFAIPTGSQMFLVQKPPGASPSDSRSLVLLRCYGEAAMNH